MYYIFLRAYRSADRARVAEVRHFLSVAEAVSAKSFRIKTALPLDRSHSKNNFEAR